MQQKLDAMIIGAQKAGTTSLLRYLGEHPECVSHQQKEFAYFTDVNEYQKGIDQAIKKYFSDLPSAATSKLIAKNSAIYVYEHGIKRLKEHNPHCELFLILRNPTERTYSSYLMEKNHGALSFSFTEMEKLLTEPGKDPYKDFFECLIDYSLYAKHIRTIQKYFPKEQLSILFYEDLRSDPAAVCKTIFKKINVKSEFIPNVGVKHNVTKQAASSSYAKVVKTLLQNDNPIKRTLKFFIPERNAFKYGEMLREINTTNKNYGDMDPETRKLLNAYYKKYNNELEALIGKDLSHWNN